MFRGFSYLQDFNLPTEEVTSKYETDIDLGLTPEEISLRLEKYGENRLQEAATISPWKLLINQFKNIITLLLLIAVGVSLFLHDYLEAIAIGVVIILNALFGFVTEYRAEKAMEALKSMVIATSKVVRGGKLIEIEARELVPGDVLIIEEGDQVTADARLISADNLATIEASLTGESEPSEKKAIIIDEYDIPVADRLNMIFMGTTVARGNGRAIVVATGTSTQIGEVSVLLNQTEPDKTPLEKRLDTLGKSLAVLSVGIAIVMVIVGALMGRPVLEILETAIALAIAAVPEGLPAVATITLAIGMTRMAKKKAIIRRLPAVETLGSTTVICTDKTGTLTENQMTLEQVWLNGHTVKITGVGYEPVGNFEFDNDEASSREHLELFLKSAALASNASVAKNSEGYWSVVGDPTEGALVVAALKNNFNSEQARLNNYKELREIPFNSDEKRMAVYYDTPDGQFLMAKGSPEIILNACALALKDGQEVVLDDKLRDEILTQNNSFSSEGLRVLGLAYRSINSLEEDPFDNLVFLGLAAIMDPPRVEAKAAIAEAAQAGIRTIMITGDQPETAKAIGNRLGLTYGDVISGKELQVMSNDELVEKLDTTSIFARVSPRHKLEIVNALKKKGQIVAMTGDGVNDAPALKEADIGIAMGIQGTEVSKEAADMILADDNFATIIRAIKEGRVIFTNISKFIHYLFSCNLSEILIIFIALLLNLPLPLVALQILWLNLVTDVFPALSLGWEQAEADVMNKPPRDPGLEFLTKDFLVKVFAHGIILAAGSLLAYFYVLQTTNNIDIARTVAFASIATIQLFHTFNVRSEKGLQLDSSLFANKYLLGAVLLVLVLQAAAIYLPFLNTVLKTTPLNPSDLLIVLITTLAVTVIVKIYNQLNFTTRKGNE